MSPPEEPPYLARGSAPWPDEYPAQLKGGHGYTFLQNGAGAGTVPGYFVDTERRRYDFHAGAGRGVITATKDALGADTVAAHDGWGLPVLVTTSPHLKQAAEYDYRTLQPSLVTDANGNRTAYVYTALGLLAAVAVMGKPGAEEGDTVDQRRGALRLRPRALSGDTAADLGARDPQAAAPLGPRARRERDPRPAEPAAADARGDRRDVRAR